MPMTNSYDITGHVMRSGTKNSANWQNLEEQFFLISQHLKKFYTSDSEIFTPLIVTPKWSDVRVL